MKAITGRRRLGLELCEMVGLDPNVIQRITLVCDVHDAAVFEVVMTVDRDRLGEFVTRRYELHEIEEPPTPISAPLDAPAATQAPLRGR